MKKMFLLLGVMALLTVLPTQLFATTIAYDVTNKGGATWEYSYMVSGSFPMDYGFTIYFDYGLYEDITPISHSGDWDVLTWQPEIIMGSEEPGAYDALALIDGASLTDPFVVSFTWLGQGTPGSQLFAVYEPGFIEFESGQTRPANPVSEPATLLLLATGLFGLAKASRCHKK